MRSLGNPKPHASLLPGGDMACDSPIRVFLPPS